MKNIATILLMLSFCSCYERQSKQTALTGEALPSFNLLLLDGSTYLNTGSIRSGKPTVLFFFSPNCPYSRAQMREIVEKMPLLKNIQFYIITNSSLTELKLFYKSYDLGRYRNITVGQDGSNFMIQHFKINSVPATFFYDANKHLKDMFEGLLHSKQISAVATG